MRSLLWLVVMSACTSSSGAPVEMGDYVVTAAHEQGTGQLDPGAKDLTFTASATDDGLALSTQYALFDGIASDVPGSGTRYHVEQYSGIVTACEAGPYKQCLYSYAETTVKSPSAGTIHIEMCEQSKLSQSCSASPSCGTAQAEQALAGSVPCAVPQTIDGTLAR